MLSFNRIKVVNKILQRSNICSRLYNTEIPTNSESEINTAVKNEPKVELSGFAKSYSEQEKLVHLKPQKDNRTFAELLRNSKFIDLGNPAGKSVTGKIYHITENDLYIDFGWKFHCVCRKPVSKSQGYVKDAIVRLRIKDLELSTKFLDTEKDLTLLEADCTLIQLISTPFGVKTKQRPVVHELLYDNN